MVYLSPYYVSEERCIHNQKLIFILTYEQVAIALVKCPICKVGNIDANSNLGLCPMCETTTKEYIMVIYELANDKNNAGVPLEDVESLVSKRLKEKFRST